MLTSTPTSLLTQIRHLYQDQTDENENEKEVGNIFSQKIETKNKITDRKLIQEIDPNKPSISNQNDRQISQGKDRKSLLQKDRNGPTQKDRKSNKLDDSMVAGEGSLIGELRKIVPATAEEKVYRF